MSIEKYNSNYTRFDWRAENNEYVPLGTLCGDIVYIVHGLYISDKGKYGPQANVVLEDPSNPKDSITASLPQRYTDTVTDMLADGDIVADINHCKVGIRVYAYNYNDKECYGIRWVDI